jgi:hypothetical protein
MFMWRVMMMMAGVAVTAGCLGGVPEPAVSDGAGIRKYSGRSLAAFQMRLDKSVTPALAETRFGKPDSIAGSGLLIYVYKLDDDRELMLGFPGFEPLIYAKVKSADGSITDLPLK